MDKKEPEQKRKAGSIRQYAVLGKGAAKTPTPPDSQTSEHSDVETQERLDSQTSESLNVETSERRNTQELGHSNVKEPGHLDVQTLEHSNAQTLGHSDTQTSERSKAQAPKRERHTIYFPPDLSMWMKHQAIDQKRDISDLVTEAVERYRSMLQLGE